MDGANMNAQVGLCRPGDIGADVCHLNLHKTFCIPARRRRPGHGPNRRRRASRAISARPFFAQRSNPQVQAIGPVSAAPLGSASILTISWMYIRMMGGDGLTKATKVAILNANYIARRLDPYFPVLFKGQDGLVAHECILDLRPCKSARRGSGGRRQAPDGLRLPRANRFVAGPRHDHDRADRERTEG